jgi:hypothetical protein
MNPGGRAELGDGSAAENDEEMRSGGGGAAADGRGRRPRPAEELKTK